MRDLWPSVARQRRSLVRPDMHKVVVERPRSGSGNKFHDSRSRLKRAGRDPEDDERPTKIGMSRGHLYEKSFNDHIKPLERWLWKQHNRPWNKVWSELSKTLPNGLHRQHIKGHVSSYVGGLNDHIPRYHRSYKMRINSAGILVRNPVRSRR